MIQFNLLPDVKKEYVKAKRTKRLITSISLFSSIVAISLTVIMFSVVNFAQKKRINDLSKDIVTFTSEIQSTEDLDKILTVQNQLSLLPDLHNGKPELSRVFNYIKFVTPEEVKVSDLTVDVLSSGMTISGTADSIATINRYVDNLKAVRYATAEDPDNKLQPFNQITTDLSGKNESATFKVILFYDPVIFNNTQDIIMNIGSQKISTVVVEEGQ